MVKVVNEFRLVGMMPKSQVSHSILRPRNTPRVAGALRVDVGDVEVGAGDGEGGVRMKSDEQVEKKNEGSGVGFHIGVRFRMVLWSRGANGLALGKRHRVPAARLDFDAFFPGGAGEVTN